ncbi:MAG: outer membrane protein transport protein [Deltaproteobacteria bacterium]|nr:outer membrane protein transport protein [Deltaproteobacteria bacterium]
MTLKNFVSRSLTLLVLLACTRAQAAGFATAECGARALAMGNAFTAIADSPSAVYFNPAGLAQMEGLQLEAGVSLVVPNFGYTLTAPGTTTDVNVSGKTQFFPIPSFYATYRIHDRVAAGIGMNAPFGLGIQWPDTVNVGGKETAWWGRSLIQEADVKVVTFNPTLAFKLHPRLMIGGGLTIAQSSVYLMRKVTSSSSLADDVQVDLSGDDLGFGGTAGILFSAVPNRLNVGLSYRSGVSINYEGKAAFTKNGSAANIPTGLRSRLIDGPVTAHLALPHVISFGAAAFILPKKLTIGFGVDVTTWSSYEELAINFTEHPELSSAEAKHWRNTVAVRLGGEYRVLPQLPLRLGLVYDQSPAPKSTVGPELPDADRYEVALGAGYRVAGLTIDLAYLFLLTGDQKTADTAPLVGTYRATAHVLALSLGYGFSI